MAIWTKKFGRNLFFKDMPAPKEQPVSRTPFKKQAGVISAMLNTNPILNDDEKASLKETVGVLTWLNQLQIHWADGGSDIPDHIKKQLFDDRKAQKPAVVQPPA